MKMHDLSEKSAPMVTEKAPSPYFPSLSVDDHPDLAAAKTGQKVNLQVHGEVESQESHERDGKKRHTTRLKLHKLGVHAKGAGPAKAGQLICPNCGKTLKGTFCPDCAVKGVAKRQARQKGRFKKESMADEKKDSAAHEKMESKAEETYEHK